MVYELFNEPPGVDTAANWALWRDGGGSQIGHKQLVSTVRATGAVNVLLADGLRYAKSLMGVPLLTDPLGQTGYAFHPYLIKPIDVASAWPAYFGTFAATHAVIATAWGAASQSNYCEAGWPSTSAALVTYLRAHHIGLAGLWGFDIPGTATTGWTWQPNTFTGFRCGVAGHGPGASSSRRTSPAGPDGTRCSARRRHRQKEPHVLKQVADGVLVHESEFCQSNAVVVRAERACCSSTPACTATRWTASRTTFRLGPPVVGGLLDASALGSPALARPVSVRRPATATARCAATVRERLSTGGIDRHAVGRTSPSRCRWTCSVSSPACPPEPR